MTSKKFLAWALLIAGSCSSSFSAPTSHVLGETHKASAPWQILNDAYGMRKDMVIAQYTHSTTTSSRLYAKSLQALINRNIVKLQQIGRSCLISKVTTPDDAASYFGCLFAVASGSQILLGAKEHFIWIAKLKMFYAQHGLMVDLATGTADPANIKSIQVPGKKIVKRWPTQTINVDSNSNEIRLDNGFVDASINGVHLKIAIDTGTSSNVYLSEYEAKQLGIMKYLTPLGASFMALDNIGLSRTDLFYAKNLRVGPIEVHNVYIDVGPGNHSFVGMNLLRRLNRFSISDHALTIGSGVDKGAAVVCGPMRFARLPVTRAFSYPFFDINMKGGKFGVILDSGVRKLSSDANFSIYVSSVGAKKLRQSALITDQRSRQMIFKTHGRTMTFPAESFDADVKALHFRMSVVEVPATALFLTDLAVDGVLTRSFLEKGFVDYDFINRKMCIGRNQKISGSSRL